jgi:hypothetical protein
MLIDEKWVSVIQADGLTSASLQEAKKEYILYKIHLDRRLRTNETFSFATTNQRFAKSKEPLFSSLFWEVQK